MLPLIVANRKIIIFWCVIIQLQIQFQYFCLYIYIHMYLDVWPYINIIFFPYFHVSTFAKCPCITSFYRRTPLPFLANMCVWSHVDKQHALYCNYQNYILHCFWICQPKFGQQISTYDMIFVFRTLVIHCYNRYVSMHLMAGECNNSCFKYTRLNISHFSIHNVPNEYFIALALHSHLSFTKRMNVVNIPCHNKFATFTEQWMISDVNKR